MFALLLLFGKRRRRGKISGIILLGVWFDVYGLEAIDEAINRSETINRLSI